MKNFTKEQAIEELKAKIPTKDKDLDLGRTISEAVDNSIELIGEDSEMELNDFVEKVFKQVKTSIGLTHSENSKVANKMQSQIDELQKKVDEKKKKTVNDDDDDEDDPKVKALQEQLDTIKKRFEDEDKKKSIAEKRAAIIAKMAESIKDKDWINDYMSQITVTEETDVDAKAKDYVAFYNKTQANVVKRSTTPKQTGGDEPQNDVKNVVAAAARIKKQMSATGGVVKTEKTE